MYARAARRTFDPNFGNGGRFLPADTSVADSDAVNTTRVHLDGDYLYFTGSSVNAANPEPENSANRDFAAARHILPLFKSSFDPAS
jgi:hypothetical protein